MMINIINRPTVIPDRYTQYPGALAPADLFGGTWQALYDEDGVFFRTGGGEALPFGDGIQQDAMRELTGTVSHAISLPLAVRNVDGVFEISARGRADRNGRDGENNQPIGFRFRASRQVPTAAEFRPINRTYRIWKRVI